MNNLPEFISPYVCQILATVLDPKVLHFYQRSRWACSSWRLYAIVPISVFHEFTRFSIVAFLQVTAIDHMGCGKLALATARRIAESVPPRLLAKPLFGMYEQASKEGEIPLVQLLDLVGVMASKMDAESTVNYHGQVTLVVSSLACSLTFMTK